MPAIYNNGQQSTIGEQLRVDKYEKAALIEARQKQFFTQLSNMKNMPKNMGKTIKKYHYMPILDARNMNDQGIDAAGVTIDSANWEVYLPVAVATMVMDNAGEATAVAALNPGATTATVTVTFAAVTRMIIVPDEAHADVVLAATGGEGGFKAQRSGNLYGSSKDIGYIAAKMPTISEEGGWVNRVGFTRITVEGTLSAFGFYDEYTEESLEFDTDAELDMHMKREMISAAVEQSEDAVQTDLINNAGVIRYAGAASSLATMDATSTVSYASLLRLSIQLDDNRTPKQTKIITGTRNVDTKTISAGRVMYIGSELLPTLEALQDSHGERAFIPAHKYAAGTSLLMGEEGSIGKFRIVVVPEMQKHSGAGADASGSATHYETNERFDVFPMLVVGGGSFTTIGFQLNGGSKKWRIQHAKPGSPTALARDPYGLTGFMSIMWYYGMLIERSERIAVHWTTAVL